MPYKLYPKAKQQLAKIWADTYQEWGEAQADKYIDGLHSKLKDLKNTPYLWRKLDHKKFQGKSIFFYRYEKHFVFFKELSSGKLGIISVLHERMNLPERLYEMITEH